MLIALWPSGKALDSDSSTGGPNPSRATNKGSEIMDYKKLADLLYPNVDKTIEDYEKEYPERDLSDKAEVCRFAPSPTGRMHMGNLFASFIPETFAHQTNGIFILRIEDTDDKRAIENGTELILEDLKTYKYRIDEDPINGGKYGPYVQSKRKNIYAAFGKYLVSIGKAYPCFCMEEEISKLREIQSEKKDRIGYYGKYAKCRNLTYEEIEEKIKNNIPWVLRLKSTGDFNKRIEFKDLIKGKIEIPENDIDHVLIKSDGIPPYAFAHVVDDHLMRVTTVTRDDSYISSVPYHLEIWKSFGFKIPKYAHILPLNKKEGEIIRKLSKRKDPEAAVNFYNERGIPESAVKLYFATLLNSNFEEWYNQNPDKNINDFTFTFDKMSKSGSLFDIEKLLNISKTYFSRLKATTLYDNTLEYLNIYDKDFYELLKGNKEYTINILNIERNILRPRKDIASYSDVKTQISYMFDELFSINDYDNIIKKDFYKIQVLEDYFNNVYNSNDEKEVWFNKIKELCPKYNFSSDTKAFKENPNSYIGSIGDLCELVRVCITGRTMTPDLYEILKLLSKESINKRIELFKSYLQK